MNLPSPAEFVAQELGIVPESAIQKGTQAQGGGGTSASGGVSNEFRALLVNFCAHYIEATELSQVRWAALAKRLGCQSNYLAEAAEFLDAEGALWQDVLAKRIQHASASSAFSDQSWKRLESLALDKLTTLMEKNLIRDSGELLAVAKAARSANQPAGNTPNTSVNINFNNGESAMGENGLPAAGTRMVIDLNPRIASTLASKTRSIVPVGDRVIDGEMISAKELREVADQGVGRAQAAESTEGVNGGEMNEDNT